jgi:hypothetical protein
MGTMHSIRRQPIPTRARARHLSFRVAGAVCAFAVGSREARADDSEPIPGVHLSVASDEAVAECPRAAEVAAATNQVIGRDRVRTADAGARDAELRIVVAFLREPGGFGATVRESGARNGERTIRTAERTCDTLTSALGATIAMMIDAADASGTLVVPAPATAQAEEARATQIARAPSNPAPLAHEPDRVGPSHDEEALTGSRTAHDGVFVGAFGNGVYDSVNYERMFWNGTFSIRVGLGFAPLNVCQAPCGGPPSLGPSGNSPQYRRVNEFTAPVLASWYWGSASHKLQVGFGVTGFFRTGEVGHDGYQDWLSGGEFDSVFSSASKGFDLAGTAVVGYRFIPAHGGPSFGGGFTPLFGVGGFLPWLSLNVGAELM